MQRLMDSERKPSEEWQELTRLTQGERLIVERVRLAGREVAIEGSFELPQLAQLSAEDQVFVIAFLRCHGSVKEMEQVFGVSYPTIKSRLTRIAGLFEFVHTDAAAPAARTPIERLKNGEITVEEAIRELENKS